MKTVYQITSVVLLVIFSLASYANDEINNPYNLITDENLAEKLADIQSHWSSGKSGSFIGVDGIRIKYMIFKKPSDVGAIVISSGRTESYIKYKETIFNFSQLGYSVYIHDHRGQGYSGRMTEDSQQGHVLDFNDYVTDLKTFFDTKIKPNEGKNLFLLAHSMGGGIASLYIEKYQNDFKAAALSSPMHQPDTGMLGRVACAGAWVTVFFRDIGISWFGMDPRYAAGQGKYEPVKFTENNPDMMTHSEQRYNSINKLYDMSTGVRVAGITSHWLDKACTASELLVENAALIKIPVLVLQAEEDIAVTSSGQNDFCENLLASGVNECDGGEPFIIPGGYHELFIESDQYRIKAMTKILDFFKEQS